MTTVLNREEITLPTTRWPNKVIPFAVKAPVDQPYVVGQPWVNPWTPGDQYAGPVPDVPTAATAAFSRHGAKSKRVPYLLPRQAEAACRSGESGSVYRDFYSGAPTNFWPCTRERMDQVGMNRVLPVRPLPFADAPEGAGSITGRSVLFAVGAGVLAYWITSKALGSR
jgi:hypothetical protein